MRINSIILKNFGPYEGVVEFNTAIDKNKNIVLIGGKNGAGKTTLFSAIRVCLFGYKSMGYKSNNHYYYKEILRLVNDRSKLSNDPNAYVELHLNINRGSSEQQYILRRSWNYMRNVEEKYEVIQDGIYLDANEREKFDRFLIDMISPDIVDLYFMDCENLCDNFFGDGAAKGVKDLFLKFSGYDILEIVNKNLKRVNSRNNGNRDCENEYVEAENKKNEIEALLIEKQEELERINNSLLDCREAIRCNETEFIMNNGLANEEIGKIKDQLKAEEYDRKNCRDEIRTFMNDIVPFIIIKDRLEDLKDEIQDEQNREKIRSFNEVMGERELVDLINLNFAINSEELVEMIQKYMEKKYPSNKTPILNLSEKQSTELTFQIDRILEFDINKITRLKADIKGSMLNSSEKKEKLKRYNEAAYREYIKHNRELENQERNLIIKKSDVERSCDLLENELLEVQSRCDSLRNKYKEFLKKKSVMDIASRSIIMMDELEDTLYEKQIRKLEENLKSFINLYSYKDKFIDDIEINTDFDISLYSNQFVDSEYIVNILKNRPEIIMEHSRTVHSLESQSGFRGKSALISYFEDQSGKIEIPLAFAPETLSSGEKQIFLMALYFSIIQMNDTKMPFIIDTPFARIDDSNRTNLIEHFFKQLKGQVFILSTDEEIEGKHFDLIEDQIAVTYLLENDNNHCTEIEKNKYFGV